MTLTPVPHCRNIVIRSANWVGDAIMTTPALRTIRHQFHAAHITLLAKPWVVPVFAHNPHVDEVMLYDTGGRHRGLKGLLRL
ncbi:MAG: lipopolysaccharide heptosyltransferase II, partial [Desulfosarcinaceae bacterium]